MKYLWPSDIPNARQPRRPQSASPFSVVESASQPRGAVKGEERERPLTASTVVERVSQREGGAPTPYRAFRPQGGERSEADRRPARHQTWQWVRNAPADAKNINKAAGDAPRR